jgi:hypothetical protein
MSPTEFATFLNNVPDIRVWLNTKSRGNSLPLCYQGPMEMARRSKPCGEARLR